MTPTSSGGDKLVSVVGVNPPSDIASAGLQRCAKEICHALHDAHLAARMPRHS